MRENPVTDIRIIKGKYSLITGQAGVQLLISDTNHVDLREEVYALNTTQDTRLSPQLQKLLLKLINYDLSKVILKHLQSEYLMI